MDFFFSNHRELNDRAKQALASFQKSGVLLITGPTGSGKTELAKQIHDHATDDVRPWIAQDAAGLAEARFESQFFGHVKGAFSGASQAFQGLLGMATDGALCIEGIEDLTLNNQARLLRFLQSRRYRALGATLEHEYTGRLILTARTASRTLKDNGVLREDFFFRISGFEMALPPAHERPLDLPDICRTLVERIQAELAFRVRVPTESELDGLIGGVIEGNFHGLRNTLQRAMIRGQAPVREEASAPPAREGPLPDTGGLKSDLHQLEGKLLQRALRLFPHSRKDLANHLGVSMRSLMYKLKDHGLNKSEPGDLADDA